MFCATYPTDLFAFIFWKSCLYIVIQLYVISMRLSGSFPVECLHHRQFSSFHLSHNSFLQGLEGFPTGSALPGPEVRDSPV